MQNSEKDSVSVSSIQYLTTPRYKSGTINTRYLCIIGILGSVILALLISTTILALKYDGAYPSARVHYHVWSNKNNIGDTINHDHLQIQVPKNATLFTVMEHAARNQRNFEFEFKQYDFGKQITSIGGVSDDVDKNLFWMIYKVPNQPKTDSPPSKEFLLDKGVDDIRVTKNDHFLFWLTTVTIDDVSHFQLQRNIKAVSKKTV